MATYKENPWVGLYQHVASIGGALALVNMLRDVIELRKFLTEVVDAWGKIVRPVSEFLFGWIDFVLGFEVPRFVHDYWVVGIILFSGSIRGQLIYNYTAEKRRSEYLKAVGPLQRKLEQVDEQVRSERRPVDPSLLNARDLERSEEKRLGELEKRLKSPILQEIEALQVVYGASRGQIRNLGDDVSILPKFNEGAPVSNYMNFAAINMFVWPFLYFAYLAQINSIDWKDSPISKERFIFDLFAPFLYFMFVLLINYFLFFAGVG